MDLVSLLFDSSNSVKSVILSAAVEMLDGVSLKQEMAEEDGNYLESIDHKLMNIPQTGRGRWHFGGMYTLGCASQQVQIQVVQAKGNTAKSAYMEQDIRAVCNG
uniref:Uncharacterized protein n=1 Tax=Arundo donax TaxID=35708 RepID=A0A0A9BE04_ARUDO